MSRYTKATDVLMQGERHRVWSLVVTIFGDLAQNKGDEISAQALSRLTEQIGIKSEALRVALHRLRKDGWLESKRLGRSSSYYLTDFGLAQSASASPRIYGLTNPIRSEWALITTPNTTEGREGDAAKLESDNRVIRLGAQVFLGEENNLPKIKRALLTRIGADPLPDWVRDQIIGPELKASYNDLLLQLQKIEKTLPENASPIERAVLRTLIVHSWRRILLRHPDIPNGFYPRSCKAIECRDTVCELLKELSRPSLVDLSTV
ncbi:MAG: PaaX family transcriptional regulator C-terminal domain-containing protein [Paracoccaceae bacterium]|nr:PaaX family transcriptional regulator C-terminal domain-containing protein [Paracoccaceae bacterium]MDG2259292.1 PaaX family transcriptional regulator C-terminal domain-containing protein [Paracoccaceae bacterium]